MDGGHQRQEGGGHSWGGGVGGAWEAGERRVEGLSAAWGGQVFKRCVEAGEAMNGPRVTWWGENQDEQCPEHQMNSSKQVGTAGGGLGAQSLSFFQGPPQQPSLAPSVQISLAKEATCLCIKADGPALSGSGRFPGWLKPESGVKAISWLTFLVF